jgi:biotin carboxyl carrier protein
MEAKSRKKVKIEKNTALEEDSVDDISSKKSRYKTLIIQGEKYKTTFSKKYENRKKWEKPNSKHVVSYIPGTVNEIYISAGDKVKKGEPMLKLEAMKMLTTIEVPYDGKISRINIKAGDRIPKGFLMIEFE